MLITVDSQIKDFGMIAWTMTNPSHVVELVAIIRMALQKKNQRSCTWCSPGVRYSLGTITNNLEIMDNLLHKEDYRMLNILGVVRSITKSLRHLHTSFGGFGLFNLPVEQRICHVNMLMQHYHTSTNLSRNLDALLQYLQLQLVMPQNPLLLDYIVWGHLAPLLWVKMLWRTLHHFDIHLYMAYTPILPCLGREIKW